ncbi:MAG: FAD-dependent oxidoreductase [Bacteroidales bacterium]|nr:FAD-dependent oxidoreductase [Bacteroidales bacterium]
MKSTDVLVIGSSAAGMVTALTGKKVYPDKTFTVIRKEEKTLVPCGIPYTFASINGTNDNILPSEKMLENSSVNLIIGEAISINREKKTCILKDKEEISYKKLVLATGSSPSVPTWLKGADLENVFSVPKDKDYLDIMKTKLDKCNKIIVVGAGFIGVELSDELKKTGKEIILIEKLPHILGLCFDEEISIKAEEVLQERGVKIITGIGVKELEGDKKVNKVLLDNGKILETDAVVLSIGYHPNTTLAKESELSLSKQGCINVDEYMRTDDPDIFAVGDCAQKHDFITRKPCCTMLASTACAEARTAGMNLFKLCAIKTFSGTISIFSTMIGDIAFGVAGITEMQASEEGFDVITGVFEGMDKHPGALPGAKKQLVKLIVGKESNVILGGEVVGGSSVGELTNIIGVIIQNRMNINSILTSQIGTHPLLTASPAGYPLLKAAENVAYKTMFK